MGVLGNHLLNCAGFHASDRGFGIATLNEDNYVNVNVTVLCRQGSYRPVARHFDARRFFNRARFVTYIATLNEDNYTWVLSRLAVELDEMPYQYENFSVQTWVENVLDASGFS